MIDEKELPEAPCETALAGLEEGVGEMPAGEMRNERGAALTPPEERPMRIRVTPFAVKLAFFHASRALPPFKFTIPHEQWQQLVQLTAYPPPGLPSFEAFVGFTPEALALHGIEAVPLGGEGNEEGRVISDQ
jgi:hypothetical protein